MNWIVITPDDTVSENQIRIHGNRFLHIKSILKKQVGETLKVIIPQKKKGLYSISEITQDSILATELTVETFFLDHSLTKTEIILALPRPQTGKKILFLVGTYGVGNVSFVLWNQKNKEYITSPLYLGKEYIDVWEGMSQSGSPYEPKLKYFKSQNECKAEIKGRILYLLDPQGVPLVEEKSRIQTLWQNQTYPLFLMGPESGFTTSEIESYQRLGAKVVSVGNVILRTEHAFHALLYQLNQWLKTDPA